MLKTGLTRVWINGERYRLRRPFFGELKQLRLALEAVRDEVEAKRDGAIQVADRLRLERGEWEADESLTPGERAAKMAEARKTDRAAARALMDTVDTLYPEWWQQVFETLSHDGVPEDMPSWVADADFVERLMAHWRSAPTGPG